MDVAKYWTQAQDLNWRHGLFRVWLVFSVVWGALFTVGGVASYIEDIGNARKPSGEGVFGDIPITNPPPSSLLPSVETIQYFLSAFLVPIAVLVSCKALLKLWVWIYGGFKSEDTEKPDYLGASHKTVAALGRWAFKIFLYVFASAVIAALLAVTTTKIYQWLDISLDSNYALTNPFVLLGILLQFAAFKWIFFKEGKKGTAFLAYVTVTIFLPVLMFGVIVLIA